MCNGGQCYVQPRHVFKFRPPPRHCERSEAIQTSRSTGLFRRGACHRAGHLGPDPLVSRNDDYPSATPVVPMVELSFLVMPSIRSAAAESAVAMEACAALLRSD